MEDPDFDAAVREVRERLEHRVIAAPSAPPAKCVRALDENVFEIRTGNPDTVPRSEHGRHDSVVVISVEKKLE